MELIENMILQNYLQYKQILQAMMAESKQLPKGNLTYRTSRGHRYCYLQYWIPGEAPHNQRIADSEIAKTEQILARRNSLLESIKILQYHIKTIEKEFPHFSSYETVPFSSAQDFSSNADKPYPTLKGDFVRSKSEVIIANELYIANITYEYEKPLYLTGYQQPFLPDFTICTPSQKKIVYWEHLGLMGNEAYRTKWSRKRRVYEQAGISEWDKTLIVTYETHTGSLNLADIRQHIAQLQHA